MLCIFIRKIQPTHPHNPAQSVSGLDLGSVVLMMSPTSLASDLLMDHYGGTAGD